VDLGRPVDLLHLSSPFHSIFLLFRFFLRFCAQTLPVLLLSLVVCGMRRTRSAVANEISSPPNCPRFRVRSPPHAAHHPVPHVSVPHHLWPEKRCFPPSAPFLPTPEYTKQSPRARRVVLDFFDVIYIHVRFFPFRCTKDDVTELHCVSKSKTEARGSDRFSGEDKTLMDTWVSVLGLGRPTLKECEQNNEDVHRVPARAVRA